MDSVQPSEIDSTVAEQWPAQTSDARLAWADLIEGLDRSWMWSALAWQDVRLRYRGSILGPFWLTISTVIMIVAMGVIFSRIFGQEPRTYMPYLMTGLVIWQFVQSSITEGCHTFLSVANVLQQVPMPFSIHAYRTVCRNLLVLAHNSVIIPIGILGFGIPVDWRILVLGPALLILALNGVWVSILLGAVSARFRDVPPIITNFLQVLFFVTPIFWPADRLGRWETLAELNPLFAAVDIVRAPLLGISPAPLSWIVVIAATMVGWAITFLFFARFRSRIAYWV